jgi:hypothetical protein
MLTGISGAPVKKTNITKIFFAFDTFSFLTLDAVDILKRVKKIMYSNVVSPMSIEILFKMINFVIQKRLATQLITRLSFIKL